MIVLSQVPEKYPKLISAYEKETGRNAISRGKINGQFEKWLNQKIKYKNLICKNTNCPDYGKEFKNKKALITHIYWHNEGYREKVGNKISKALKGKPKTEEHKRKISCRIISDETRIKMSKASKEVHNRPEVKENQSIKIKEMWNKPRFRKKIKEAMNRPEVKAKHSRAMIEVWQRPEYRKSLSGENASNWKNNEVSYHRIHMRAHITDPKSIDGICEICGNVTDIFGKAKLEHSNKDHTYKLPINPDDWQWVHYSCHKKYDSKNNT